MTTSEFARLQELLLPMAERERLDPDRYPEQSIADLYDAGIMSAPFPAEFGGAGWKLSDCVRAIEAIASASPSTALIASMPLGLAGIYGFGTAVAQELDRAAWQAQSERVAADYRKGLVY